MRQTRNLLAALLTAAACVPPPANAAPPNATLHVNLSPEHLGQGTTLSFRLHLQSPPGGLPTPVTQLDLDYPSSLGIAVSGLGLLSCPLPALEELGAQGCPPNAWMGVGHATAVIPFGPELVSETAEIAVLRAPEQQNHLAISFFIDAHTPVSDEIIVPGVLLPGANPTQETLQVNVPLLKALAGGPDAALVQLDASIGPNGLTYREHVHGHVIRYKPAGILLPNQCPAAGFQFTARITYATEEHTTTDAQVPCPKKVDGHTRREHR